MLVRVVKKIKQELYVPTGSQYFLTPSLAVFFEFVIHYTKTEPPASHNPPTYHRTGKPHCPFRPFQ